MSHHLIPFPKLFKSTWNKIMQSFAYSAFPSSVRCFFMRMKGVKIGKGVFLGSYVYIDDKCPELIEIGSGSYVTAKCIIVAHQRDLSLYRTGMMISEVPLKNVPVKIGKGVHLGMGSIVLPGVTIGDGAVIGAGSVVSKDIPSYVIAVGIPAKPLRSVPD